MVPTRIACSSATRARQTCDRMLKVFGDDPKVDYRQSLYEGGVQSVFDELAQTKEKHRELLVLGHEPLCRSHANGWRAPNRMQCCSTC